MGKKKTLENFVADSRKVHGDKYDYSHIEYIDTKTRITIRCPVHGPFIQFPYCHMKGQGCGQCAIENGTKKPRLTLDQFIEKSKKVHGEKYDYSQAVYISSQHKVSIICPLHGLFKQTPSSHVREHGCKECGHILCADSRRVSTNEFIACAKEIHGDTYDYSKVEYISSSLHVTIICKKHGEFKQTPDDHKKGGCFQCGRDKTGLSLRNSQEGFLSKAKTVHGDTYDYSKAVYVKNSEKITIICKLHGEFSQTPSDHLTGKGCNNCGIERTKCSKGHFIEKANKIHMSKYDYSKVEYINNLTPIIIICPHHGEFLQTPNKHIQARGCPTCNESKGEICIRKFLEREKIPFESQKIFDGCKNDKHLKIDIFIPSLNLCIEYDGKQHFEPIEYFGGLQTFEKVKLNDSIKTEFCASSKIGLLRLSQKPGKELNDQLERCFKLFKALKARQQTFIFDIDYEKHKYSLRLINI